MTTYRDLVLKTKELAGLLKPTVKVSFPSEVLQQAVATLGSLIDRLSIYLPPTAAEKRAAKADPTAAQIVKFTTLDTRRKKFFNAAYFQNKLKALPHDRLVVAPSEPKTAAGGRDALVLYYYRGERIGLGRALKQLQEQLEHDYGSSPEAVRLRQFKNLFSDLMACDDVDGISDRLAAEFPDEAALKSFAKEMGVKIPAQKRGKGAEKKTAHQRLAGEIYHRAGVAKIDRSR